MEGNTIIRRRMRDRCLRATRGINFKYRPTLDSETAPLISRQKLSLAHRAVLGSLKIQRIEIAEHDENQLKEKKRRKSSRHPAAHGAVSCREKDDAPNDGSLQKTFAR
jgi:hypothetical protein